MKTRIKKLLININFKKNNLLFYLIVMLLSYFLYVYPFELFIYFLFDIKIFISVSSLITTAIIAFILIIYYKTSLDYKILSLIALEGLVIGMLSFFVFNFILIIYLIFQIHKLKLIILGCTILLFLVLLSFYNAKKIKLKKIKILSPKIKRNYRFFFISDVHLGSNDITKLKRMVENLMKSNFDCLLIGGDLYDKKNYDLKNLRIFKRIKQPIFYVSGNHEYYMRDFKKKFKELKKYNVSVLDNKNIILKEINFIGLSDFQTDIDKIKIVHNSILEKKFNFVLSHKPSIYSQIDKIIDFMISGHTHNGQVFPFNLIVKIKFKNIYGLYIKNNSQLYVSSGFGCWGPKMRLGSDNEIIEISLLMKNEKNNVL